ncbi:MAG TPA: aminotransferase class V-fold PLP-dependent enzyme [Fimbriimonadaceae bacterium]|nr:aminotransferase class V-fold PLP-dependent enzyme [Fimbriimonadaceae bacterium]
MMSRRDLLFAVGAAAAFRNTALSLLEKHVARVVSDPNATAEDEEFWLGVRQAFSLDPNIVNFNNGGCSPSPRVVQECLRRQLEFANQAPSYFMWRNLEPEIEGVRNRLAKLFGADPEEVAITRNASESLMTCLFGLPLEPGDEVLTTTQDYPRMINTIKQRSRREGIKLVQIDVPPAPETQKEIVDAFEKAITPKTKMILVSHVVFMTGQINPVHDICELGKKRGIPVIVDGAHAFAHFPFTRDELDCDYFGTSLHKWLMAPIGTGMLYVRKPLIPHVWPLMAADQSQDENVRKFEEIGTHQAAVHNAIGEALTFHEMLGGERKAARLRYLRSRWINRLQEHKNVRFHTNLHPDHSCGICTVEIEGIKVGDLSGWLESKHKIIVTGIEHPQFHGIRVSPSVYSTVAEIDRFGDAMVTAATKGIG